MLAEFVCVIPLHHHPLLVTDIKKWTNRIIKGENYGLLHKRVHGYMEWLDDWVLRLAGLPKQISDAELEDKEPKLFKFLEILLEAARCVTIPHELY